MKTGATQSKLIQRFGGCVARDAGQRSKRADNFLAAVRFCPISVARRLQVRGSHGTTPWLIQPGERPLFWGECPPFQDWTDVRRRSPCASTVSGQPTAGLLLAIVTATGVILALPVVKAALFGPAPVPPARSPGGGGPPVPLVRALAVARAVVPDARLVFLDVPGDVAQPYRVRVQVPGDPHRRFPGSYVFVDQRSARVVAVQDMRSGGISSAINAWVRPLHDGSVGGMPVRILAVLVGIAPAMLFVTGLLRWRIRTRPARPARRLRRRSRRPAPG